MKFIRTIINEDELDNILEKLKVFKINEGIDNVDGFEYEYIEYNINQRINIRIEINYANEVLKNAYIYIN